MVVSMSVIALGCIVIFACARDQSSRTLWIGLSAFLIIALSFGTSHYRFAQIRDQFEAQIADNPFAQSARESFQSAQIEWGWLVLLLATALIVFAAFSERKANGLRPFAISDDVDKPYTFAGIVVAAVGLAMMLISQVNAGGSVTNDPVAASASDTGAAAIAEAEEGAAERAKREYISKHLAVYELEARYMDSMLDGRVPGLTFKVKNNGDQTLDRVEVTVEFLNASGDAISEEVYNPVIAGGYSSDPPLRPGHIWQNERGSFYAAKSVPSEWASGRARARVTDIEFASD